MLNRRRLASCLLLSVVSLGFLVAQANAASTQDVIFFFEGYVRLAAGRFSGSIQPAQVTLALGMGGYDDFIDFDTLGYWNIGFDIDAIVIYGGDGSVSASCFDVPGHVKLWTNGLYLGSPATLNFYLPPFRGQFSGVLVGAIG